MTTVKFNMLDPEFRANPYPTYYRMLRESRVYYYEDWKRWIFFGFDDCFTLLRHPNLGHIDYVELQMMGRSELVNKFESLFKGTAAWMLFKNPPDHTRLRSLVHKAFTPKLLDQMKDDIKDLTSKLLDAAEAKGEFDLIRELALPLPIAVITRMIGVPDDRTDDLHRWSSAVTFTLNSSTTPEQYQEAYNAYCEYVDYLTGVIQDKRANPQADLISEMIQAEEDGKKLSHDELIANIMLLLNAGHETTVSLIGSGMLSLFQNPDLMKLLRENPDLMPQAVEEMMRYNSPVQSSFRFVLAPFEYNGIQFQAGQSVQCLFAAANRDPEKFENPETFDITRKAERNLGFGMGVHYCLGAPLARMETEIVISMLLERFPNLSLIDENPKYKLGLAIRCLESLQVKI